MMMVRAALWMIAVIASVGGERPDWMEEDEGAIVLLGGGVRTFLCAYDSVVNNLAAPLDADLFAYMKTREGTRGRPRPRALDDARIRVRLATYERFVGASLVERLSCDDECLLSLVGCRGRFGGYLKNDTHLGRAIGQHKLLEMLGHALRRLETERGRRYEWVAWVRPDVAIKAPYPKLAGLEASHEWRSPCGGDVDMGRVLRRDDAERLLFSGMREVRRECDGASRVHATEAEDLVRHALPHNRGCLRARPLRACRLSD